MSETRTLKDKLKNAQEVTSLASTDRLMVVGVDGSPKRISKSGLDTITISCEANKWYRIVTLTANQASVGQLLIVSSPSEQECFMLRWSIPRTGYFSPSQVDVYNPIASASFAVMPKIRVCKPASSGFALHFDVFVAKAKTLTLRINSINADFNVVESPSIAELSVREFNLNTSSWGGGKTLPFNQLHNQRERRVA